MCQISKLAERSLDADLALALSLNGRELFRDEQPLKILLMSATLDGERLASLLDDAPVLQRRADVPGGHALGAAVCAR